MDTEHEFDDRGYVRKWAETADQRRPERVRMFQHIVALLQDLRTSAPNVLELGCGPGALAESVLSALPRAMYEGIDFSHPMLELAQERLARFGARVRLWQCDLRCDDWSARIAAQPHAIITNQALHDLGSTEAVETVYKAAFALLSAGGLFVNAELVVAPGAQANKPAKLPVERHLAMLTAIGFADVRTDLEFGEYVAIAARRPG